MTSKKYLPILMLLFTGMSTVWGQAAPTGATAATATNPQQLSQIMTVVLLVSAVVLFVISLIIMLKANSFLTRRLMRLEGEKMGIVFPSESTQIWPVQEDFFTRMRKKYWENPIPREREGEIILNHNYDGIRELDNHLPPWWINMFFLTIVWAAIYMWYFHFGGGGVNQATEYKQNVEAAKKEIAVALAGKANAVDESNVLALTDHDALGQGELIFKNTCAACHGQNGEGLVGPNFTDDYWLHGGGIKNIFKTIKYGVPEKGMIAWASQLKPADMQKVASYILTLKGTNPPNQKAQQGIIWKEDTAGTDTTSVKKG